MKKNKLCRDLGTARKRFRVWLKRPLGRLLREHERRQIRKTIANLFGYHILQLGTLIPEDDLLGASRIRHKLVTDPSDKGAGVLCAFERIPLASDGIDAVVAPHILEFADEPHEVLREIERILIPEGRVLLTVFNPWSLWGLWSLILGRSGRVPWCGQFLTSGRLHDWLLLLGFEVEKEVSFFYRPPFQSGGIMRRLRFIERIGAGAWPILGGVNLILARKRVVAMTPIQLKKRRRRRMVPAGVVEPTTRSAKRVGKS